MSEDPVLNEIGLVSMLDCQVGVDNTARLQAGAMTCLVDGFDRKINREEFVQLLLAAFSLYGQMAKLFLLGEVRDGFNRHMAEEYPQPHTFAELLRNTQESVHTMARGAHGDVKKRTGLMVRCPTSADRVH